MLEGDVSENQKAFECVCVCVLKAALGAPIVYFPSSHDALNIQVDSWQWFSSHLALMSSWLARICPSWISSQEKATTDWGLPTTRIIIYDRLSENGGRSNAENKAITIIQKIQMYDDILVFIATYIRKSIVVAISELLESAAPGLRFGVMTSIDPTKSCAWRSWSLALKNMAPLRGEAWVVSQWLINGWLIVGHCLSIVIVICRNDA